MTTPTSPRHQELDKLEQIASQVQAIEFRVDERLPEQRQHLAAFICARKWRLYTLSRSAQLTQDAYDVAAKKLRMEVGAFDYLVKEQSELLTRYLCELDNILSFGNTQVKEARKALVVRIQTVLLRADALKRVTAKLKEFMERVITGLPVIASDEQTEPEAESPVVATHAQTEPETDAVKQEQPAVATQQDDAMAEEDADEPMETVQPLFADVDDEEEDDHDNASADEDAPMETADDEQPLEASAADDQSDDEEEDEDDEEEEDEQEEQEHAAEQGEHPPSNAASDANTASLPVWKPYYQIQKRPDGVYVRANLQGVDSRHLRVEAFANAGVLKISGVKLPTQKDLILSRISGAPTFGRFEIVEQFPARLLNLDNVRPVLLRDGTLQVQLPYYFVHHPRVLRRASPFQPHRLCVW